MWDNFIDYIRGLSAKDLIAPVLTGMLALMGTVYVTSQKNRATREIHDADSADKARLADHNYNIAQTQDLTLRFRALMDGYEVHIRDLTSELSSTRDMLRELQGRYDTLRVRCVACGHLDGEV